jgi:ubiquitin conjugation factor E4 B
MENPVILPTSKVSIDLATIKSHLLSDPTDPFNRTPLKIEDVVPGMPSFDVVNVDNALKAEILEFKREKRARRE